MVCEFKYTHFRGDALRLSYAIKNMLFVIVKTLSIFPNHNLIKNLRAWNYKNF